jgi:hypothetical protein
MRLNRRVAMTTRRRFVQVAASAAAGAIIAPMWAEERCGPALPSAWGPYRTCAAEVPLPAISAFADVQHQSQWCWAACISMIFRYYGHGVSQQRIVSEVYGVPANMPAGSGRVVAQQLNRRWIDDAGNAFRSSVTAAYDYDAGVGNMDNAWMINELRNNRPFIMGARTHAMVVTKIVYDGGAAGIAVRQVGIVDPWPGAGLRALYPDEMTIIPLGGSLRFLASVNVS